MVGGGSDLCDCGSSRSSTTASSTLLVARDSSSSSSSLSELESVAGAYLRVALVLGAGRGGLKVGALRFVGAVPVFGGISWL